MLINLRNALMAGKRLPYDAEVEHLESTGTQYIDTGVLIDTSTDTVEITFMPHAETSGYQAYYGTDETGKGQFSLRKNTNGNNIQVLKNTAVSAGITADEKWHTVKVTPDKAIVDGVDIALTQADAQYTKPLMLFARITTADTITAYAKCRIASFKIYRNGVLVRDFIPVRRGTVGYLYDRVSKRLFGNSGTGDFVLGPDVVPVEYIESTGTEYINTGVDAAVGLSIDTTFAYTAQTTYGILFGVQYPANNFMEVRLSANTTTLTTLVKNAVTTMSAVTFNDVNRFVGKWTYTGADLDLNGTTYTSTVGAVAGSANYPLYIFAGNQDNSAVYCSKARIYSFKITNANDTPVRSFRPVRVGTEGAMMDVLTRRIYRNAGTGAFTYGGDLPYPIPA